MRLRTTPASATVIQDRAAEALDVARIAAHTDMAIMEMAMGTATTRGAIPAETQDAAVEAAAEDVAAATSRQPLQAPLRWPK